MIITDSEFSRQIMLPAKKILDELGMECEMSIVSSHRTSKLMRKFICDAEKKGCKIFICAAKMAAYLASAVAFVTTYPVIEVPLTSDHSPLMELSSLFSTVKLPSGIPIATMPIDGAENAAWFVAQMLAMSDSKPTNVQNQIFVVEEVRQELANT